MTIRPFRDQDRARALQLLGDARAIDSPSHRICVSDAGDGLALWMKPDAGEEAYLGPVITSREDRTLFYELVRACAQDAIEEGFERAYFTVHDRWLLRRLQRDFDIEPQVVGRNPETGQVTSWRVEVDIRDALRQLQRVLRRLR